MSSVIVSVGVIAQLEESEAGYHRLVIRTHSPFDFQFIRFQLWSTKRLNINGEKLSVGENVKICYEKAKFLKLKTIGRVALDICDICGAFSERNDEPVSCDQCSDISEDDVKKRINFDLKLIAKSEKEYAYSLGRRLTFVDNDSEEYYFTIVYENDPIYPKTENLHLKKIYLVNGWEKSKSDDGYVIKVMEIKDMRA